MVLKALQLDGGDRGVRTENQALLEANPERQIRSPADPAQVRAGRPEIEENKPLRHVDRLTQTKLRPLGRPVENRDAVAAAGPRQEHETWENHALTGLGPSVSRALARPLTPVV